MIAIHWLIPQMPLTVRVGKAKFRNWELSPDLLHGANDSSPWTITDHLPGGILARPGLERKLSNAGFGHLRAVCQPAPDWCLNKTGITIPRTNPTWLGCVICSVFQFYLINLFKISVFMSWRTGVYYFPFYWSFNIVWITG